MPKTIFTAIASILLSQFAQAQVYYGNGYTIIDGVDTDNTGDDLSVKVFKTIRADTVEEGLMELLQGSGWALALIQNADPDIYRLYRQPYPDFKRTLNPISLGAALEYIAGDAWDLVVDPVNKLVSFQIDEAYSCFTMTEATCATNTAE